MTGALDPLDGTASGKTARNARTKLRRRLRAEGLSPAEVEAGVRQWEYARWYRINRAPITPPPAEPEQVDDRRFRPAAPDPLLKGAARASGATAAAVRRGRALTRDEYLRLTTEVAT